MRLHVCKLFTQTLIKYTKKGWKRTHTLKPKQIHKSYIDIARERERTLDRERESERAKRELATINE